MAEVRAARGGLEGGEGRLPRASGKPLCPASAGSGVVKAGQARRSVDDIAAGENVGLTEDILAITITTVTVGFTGRHCFG